MANPYVYQDVVQPGFQYSWELMREHEPARRFVAASTQYLFRADPPMTTVPLTMACWFQSIDITGNYMLMSATVNGSNDNRAHMSAAGNIGGDPVRYVIRDTSTVTIDTTTGYTANRWYHACAASASTASHVVYIDGGSDASSGSSTTLTGIDRIAVAVRLIATPGAHLSGVVFWPCWWDVGLNRAEVERLASGVPPWYVRPESIVACPDLDSLWDPFIQEAWTNNNGATITSPYRDWTIPSIADLLGSAAQAAAITAAEIAAADVIRYSPESTHQRRRQVIPV